MQLLQLLPIGTFYLGKSHTICRFPVLQVYQQQLSVNQVLESKFTYNDTIMLTIKFIEVILKLNLT